VNVKQAPGLWRKVKSEIKGNRMIMRASRDYRIPYTRYAKWNVGDVKPFFVGVLHKKSEVYARSPLINLYVFDGGNEPEKIRLMRHADKYT